MQAAQKLLADDPDLLFKLWNDYADSLSHNVQVNKFHLSSSSRSMASAGLSSPVEASALEVLNNKMDALLVAQSSSSAVPASVSDPNCPG